MYIRFVSCNAAGTDILIPTSFLNPYYAELCETVQLICSPFLVREQKKHQLYSSARVSMLTRVKIVDASTGK